MAVTLDPAKTSSLLTLSNGNLTALRSTSSPGTVGTSISTAPAQSTGKWYYEITIDSLDPSFANSARVGLATSATTFEGAQLGEGGGAGAAYGYSGTGNLRRLGSTEATGTGYATGDIIGVAVDLDTLVLKIFKNNTLVLTYSAVVAGSYFPAIHPGIFNPDKQTVNFGAVAFAFTPPAGHIAWAGAGEPTTSDVAIAIPAITLSAFAYPPYIATVDIVIPALSLSGNSVTVAIAIPKIILSASILGDNVSTITVAIPAARLVAQVFLPNDAQASVSLPALLVASNALNGEIITASLNIPALTLVVSEINPLVIGAALTMPAPQLVASGFSGNTATAALNIPVVLLTAAGYPASTMSALLVMPAPRISSYMSAAILSAHRTWVLNTRKQALTEYGSEFAFNSYAVFNGQILAAGSNGLVVLGLQALDNTTPITARARTGQEGFGTSFHKRVPRIYVSGAFTGDVLFRTITAESGPRTYRLPYNNGVLLQQRRIPVGKGPRSRFWQFEIENENGADFSINDILVYPSVLKRRVE